MKSFILSVYGPRSGVGKTSFAVNLALSLARQSRGRVAILDFDAHDCGDVATLLGISPPPSLSELALKIHLFSPKEFCDQGGKFSDKISAFQAFRAPMKMSTLAPHLVDRLLDTLRSEFQYLIVDCGSSIEAQNLPILEASSIVFFCTTPEILALNRSTQSLNEFQSLAFPSDLIQLVVNRFDSQNPITESIIRQKLKKDCQIGRAHV